MKKQVTVIIYTRGKNDVIGYSMKSKRVWFWESNRNVSQKMLWQLVNENKNSVITNVQIF